MRVLPQLRHRAPSPRSGFTLIEVVVFIAVTLSGLLALSYTSVTAHSLRRQDEERGIANLALVSALESLQQAAARPVPEGRTWGQEMQLRFGVGGIPGNTLAVDDLATTDGNPATCRITLITDETTTDDAVGFVFGMPRDLNNDGDANDADVADDVMLLPAVVRLDWNGVLGPQSAVQGTLLLGF